MTQEIVGVHPDRRGVHLATVRLGGSDLLVSVSDSGTRVWDPRTRTLVAEFRVDYPGVNSIAVCPRAGRTPVIALATEDGVFGVDAATGEASYPAGDGQSTWGLATAAMPDGSIRLFGSAHCEPFPVLCWDAATGAPLPPVGFHDTSVKSVAVIPPAGGP